MASKSAFLAAVQRRTASVAVGASTVRGMGAAGTAAAARQFLTEVNLRDFAVSTERRFRSALDRKTDALVRSLPRGARHWGLARKLLNIFLRDALYNVFLARAYRLQSIESWLEIPLDSHVGKRICAESKHDRVPAWGTIKGLTPEVSALFQAAAHTLAERHGVAPVHLDLFYWRSHG